MDRDWGRLTMDLFKIWLDGNRDHSALVSRSYKSFYQNENRMPYVGKINEELDTYGDAVLKLAICAILYDRKDVDKENITELKIKYETDKALVGVIARHYDLIDYIKFDRNNGKIPTDYDYRDDGYKYIATALEASLAAIYIEENRSIKKILEIVEGWMRLVDEAKGQIRD